MTEIADGLYFVREKGSDRIYTARKELWYMFRDITKKETAELEVVERVPPEVVISACKGVKILNLGKTMGFFNERE